MGQLLLGFRSLLVKVAIFVVMAALLAWALGGTLWPRPVVIEGEPLHLGTTAWYWSLTVGGDRIRGDRSEKRPRWTMLVRMNSRPEGIPFPDRDEPVVFHEVTEPIRVDDRIAFAGQLTNVPQWAQWNSPQSGEWVLFIAEDRRSFDAHRMPDRLAVEQQLARLRAGLSVQDEQTILAQRSRVLDPVEHAAE